MTNTATLDKSTTENGGDERADRTRVVEQEIDRMFEEVKQTTLTSLTNSCKELIEQGMMDQAEADASLFRQQQYFESPGFDHFGRRALTVTNNFWVWWTGSWRRELEESSTTPSLTFPNPEKYRKYVADFDETIKECGYGDVGPLILTNDSASLGPELWNKRMHIVADVYLKMLEKGYEDNLLRT